MKFYFIGIKGSGMSSLAMLVKDKGHEVRGSDVGEYIFTEEELNKRNIPILSFNKTISINANTTKNVETKVIFFIFFCFKPYLMI